MPADPKAAPAPAPTPSVVAAIDSPMTLGQVMMSNRAPWWVPQWPQQLAVGLYGMTFWILYVLSPAKGEEPSDLFKTLAVAIVLTAFVNGVVAAVYTSSRDSQKKNDVIAAQAQTIAAQNTPPTGA